MLLVNDHFHFGGGGDAVLKFEAEVLKANGYEVYTFSFYGRKTKNLSIAEYREGKR